MLCPLGDTLEASAHPALTAAAAGLLPHTPAVTAQPQVRPVVLPRLRHHRLTWLSANATTRTIITIGGSLLSRHMLQQQRQPHQTAGGPIAVCLLNHLGLRLAGNQADVSPIDLHHVLSHKIHEALRSQTPLRLTQQAYVSVTEAAALRAPNGTGETSLNLVVKPNMTPRKPEAPADRTILDLGQRQRPIAGLIPQPGPQQHGARTPAATTVVIPQLLLVTQYSGFSCNHAQHSSFSS